MTNNKKQKTWNGNGNGKQKPEIRLFFFCPLPEEQKPTWDFVIFQKKKRDIQKKIYDFFCVFPWFEIQRRKNRGKRHFFFPTPLFFFHFQFLRWDKMRNRLLEPYLFYEESSWFDGEFWEKPFFSIRNDHLLIKTKMTKHPFLFHETKTKKSEKSSSP